MIDIIGGILGANIDSERTLGAPPTLDRESLISLLSPTFAPATSLTCPCVSQCFDTRQSRAVDTNINKFPGVSEPTLLFHSVYVMW